MPDYTVYLALRDEDLPSLAEAAQEAFDPERLAVITELTVGGEEGPVELGLTMSANSPGEAGRFGEEAYARLRETGLSLAAPNVVRARRARSLVARARVEHAHAARQWRGAGVSRRVLGQR